MEALLCANMVWYILNNHTFEVLAGKIYIYIHLYMDTSTEYSQVHWPQNQQILNCMRTNHIPTGKSYAKGTYKKCVYIILNIRSMFWINVLREDVSIYMKAT